MASEVFVRDHYRHRIASRSISAFSSVFSKQMAHRTVSQTFLHPTSTFSVAAVRFHVGGSSRARPLHRVPTRRSSKLILTPPKLNARSPQIQRRYDISWPPSSPGTKWRVKSSCETTIHTELRRD